MNEDDKELFELLVEQAETKIDKAKDLLPDSEELKESADKARQAILDFSDLVLTYQNDDDDKKEEEEENVDCIARIKSLEESLREVKFLANELDRKYSAKLEDQQRRIELFENRMASLEAIVADFLAKIKDRS